MSRTETVSGRGGDVLEERFKDEWLCVGCLNSVSEGDVGRGHCE